MLNRTLYQLPRTPSVGKRLLSTTPTEPLAWLPVPPKQPLSSHLDPTIRARSRARPSRNSTTSWHLHLPPRASSRDPFHHSNQPRLSSRPPQPPHLQFPPACTESSSKQNAAPPGEWREQFPRTKSVPRLQAPLSTLHRLAKCSLRHVQPLIRSNYHNLRSVPSVNQVPTPRPRTRPQHPPTRQLSSPSAELAGRRPSQAPPKRQSKRPPPLAPPDGESPRPPVQQSRL